MEIAPLGFFFPEYSTATSGRDSMNLVTFSVGIPSMLRPKWRMLGRVSTTSIKLSVNTFLKQWIWRDVKELHFFKFSRRFSSDFLYRIRNEVPLAYLLRHVLRHPCKNAEGYDRFVCPVCWDYNAAINPKNNLGRCFRCRQNFNSIEFVMILKQLDFPKAVYFLQNFLPK